MEIEKIEIVEKKEKSINSINWGLIGCGDIATRRVAPALKNLFNARLLACARAQSNLVANFAEQFKIPRWYETWEDLLEDDEIDAVYLATPVAFHCAQTCAAAKKGKHVLCEKPMALNVKEAELMIRTCQKNGVKLGLSYYRRYYPVVNRIKDFISSKKLGRPILAVLEAYSFFNPEPSHPRSWLIKHKLAGGGPLKDFGCHRLELLVYLFGKPQKITGFSQKPIFREREVEDTATCLLLFEGDIQAFLSVSHSIQEKKDSLKIYFERGCLETPVLNEGKLIALFEGKKSEELLPPASNLHFPLIQSFTESIIEDRDFEVSGEIGLEVEKIIEKVYSKNY